MTGEDQNMGKKRMEKEAEKNQKENALASMPALDATRLMSTLGIGLSDQTRNIIQSSSEPLRASMILGSPDFMQH